MKHIFVRSLATGLAAAVLLSLGNFSALCGEIRSEVVRLHVLANSDSEKDQQLKLQVRDAVLSAADGLMNDVTDKELALETAKAHLPELQNAAQQCVYQQGYTYPVHVSLCEMYFTTRTYETGTLPAGWYHALRVTVGEGNGRNWWCVVFPPLCLGSAKGAALHDVLDQKACDVVEDAPKYEIRFKVVEWLEKLKTRK